MDMCGVCGGPIAAVDHDILTGRCEAECFDCGVPVRACVCDADWCAWCDDEAED